MCNKLIIVEPVFGNTLSRTGPEAQESSACLAYIRPCFEPQQYNNNKKEINYQKAICGQK
jgi:hypothetical protein